MLLLLLFGLLIAVSASCQPADIGEQDSAAGSLSSPVLDYVVYEAVFVDNEEIESLFQTVRGQAPFPKITADYHVTTAFLPEKDARELYGKEVVVRITGYKVGEITMGAGGTTQNEGFKVELRAQDPDLTAYLSSSGMNDHITGSYVDQAKYTGYLDFSDARPLEYVVKGTFGAYLNSGRITFDEADVDRVLDQ